jgi:hypothetical protein
MANAKLLLEIEITKKPLSFVGGQWPVISCLI